MESPSMTLFVLNALVSFSMQVQKKVQTLRETRDYSFLLSDDADLPIPASAPPKPVVSPAPPSGQSTRPSGQSTRPSGQSTRPSGQSTSTIMCSFY